MAQILASYWRFFSAALTNQAQIGAVVPSQRFLIDKMIAPIPRNYAGQVLELGPGTGALTLRLASRCRKARVLACEINSSMACHLRWTLASARLSNRVEVILDSAEHLLTQMSRRGLAPDFIVSGIPLANLKREQVLALAGAISRGLAPGGMYIQFQYSLLDRRKIKAHFSRLTTVPVLLNFPPAVVYYAQK
ncbi:MAG TPA: methyltransferase domain-containing protein [Verrucomicrobiae bacterium]|nr:methyltransferase domain-containing protein [Verrucomicrobiae bacterium]